MLTTWKSCRRFGFLILLMTCKFWTATPVLAGAGATADVNETRRLAEKGSINDEIALAGDYFAGKGVSQDSKMAAYWYEKAAGHGNPAAQNQIGYFYQAGIGVTQDSDRAFHWYQLAAASGFARAKVNLAITYLNGLGTRKNGDLAVQLLKQAFDAGNGTAATYLGLISYFGMVGMEDKIAAERWFELGLKLHDPLAAFNLGSLYSVTAGHPQDLSKAADLLGQAVDGGYVPAMHSLGLLLINNPSLKQDDQKSLALLEAAANAGNWKSSIVLGILARDGRGVPPDAKVAYYHFRIAILQGGEKAERLVKRDMDVLRTKIGSEERRAEEIAANTWFEHHSLTLAFVYRNGTKGDFPTVGVASAPDGSFAGQLLPLSSS
jgi:TPR repeat protein